MHQENTNSTKSVALKALSARFSLARAKSGKTQTYLAHICGVTKAAISAIENGRNGVSGENVFPLADALGVDARWLLTGVGESVVAGGSSTQIPTKISRIAQHLAALPDKKLDALATVLGIHL